VNRREEILSVNKKWAIDVLIKVLAFVYEVKDFDNPIFEELENIEKLLLWILFGLMCVISIVVFSLLIRDIIEKRFAKFVYEIPEVKEEEFFK